MTLVSSGDIIFSAGEMPSKPKMYFICTGTMQYHHFNGQFTELHDRDWISEPVLWTNWMHRGHLMAGSDSRLCYLDSLTFQEISCQFAHHNFDVKAYAHHFVDGLNACEEPDDLASESEIQAEPCPGGCGFAVGQEHATHCCAMCKNGDGHGHLCKKKPYEEAMVCRTSTHQISELTKTGLVDKTMAKLHHSISYWRA
jgi:hypothetical protein